MSTMTLDSALTNGQPLPTDGQPADGQPLDDSPIENHVSALDDRLTVHENAVRRIVGMIRSKYRAEGIRNFSIGREFLLHERWRKANCDS